MGLLGAPLAPVRGVNWLARTLAEQAEREMADPARLRRELERIEADHESGALSDEERDRLEAAVIGRMLGSANAPGGSAHGGSAHGGSAHGR
jgi:hypothetical protein